MEKPKRPLLKIFLIIFGGVALVAIALVARFNFLREDPMLAFSTPAPRVITTPTPLAERVERLNAPIIPYTPTPTPTLPPEHVLGANTINIVLMGLDSDEEREAANRGYRSDTIAILVVDVKAPSCTVLSVPRDTRAKVQRLNSKGQVKSTQYNKINSAYNYGGGPDAFGADNLIVALESLLFDDLNSDVQLGYYASIDMDSVEKFADAVDGVPITLPYDIPNFGKENEEIVLRGEDARKFVRLRHGITGGSDIGRVERQQLFIKAFAKKIQQLGARDIIPLLWSSLAADIQTNLNTEQIMVLADLLARLDLEKCEFVTLPGYCKTIEGRSYYVPKTKEVKALALKLWGGEKL
ncbi:LCP family protein [Eubacteriales bacterium OttesenSCG-928-K08]|nr:LCP family protein [Eubacteriales bacterium OttesenSCG-928-K08]